MTNFNLKNFQKGIFNGLKSLKTLRLYQVRSPEFVTGWLAGVAQTLENILVYGISSLSYNLLGLTSGVAMENLTLVICSLNLSDTINENTFTGLVTVRTLELSFCNIDSIGPKSFDSIASTLRLLKLNNNQLKQLPEGIFAYLLPNPSIRIYLSENPFDCSCGIIDLQNQLQLNLKNFVDTPKCYTPFYFYNDDINTAEDICWNGTDPNSVNKFVRCYDDNNYVTFKYIKRHEHQSRIIQNKNNSIKVQPLRVDPKYLIMVINEVIHISDDFNPTLACFSCKPLKPVKWTEFEIKHLYIICVMDPIKVRTLK